LAIAGTALVAQGSGQTAPAAEQVQTPVVAAGGTIRGTVKAGSTALPGVAVTATNTLTGKKYATTTDINGVYAMTIPKTGRYVVKAELAAFATATSEVRITNDAANQTAAFTLELASRAAAAQAATEQAGTAAATSQLAAALGRGTQALSMAGAADGAADASVGVGNAGVAAPSLGGFGDASSGATESVAITGVGGSTSPLAGLSQDEIQDRINNAMAQARQQGGAAADQANAAASMLGAIMGGPGGFGPGGGGFGGGRGGGRGGGGGGGFRNFNPAQPHGSVFYQGAYGALNALPFSLSGAPETRENNQQNRFGVTFIGSPSIPHLLKANTKQFIFFNLTGQRNITPDTLYAIVPTLAERGGDFSGLTQTVNGQLVPITLYNPANLGMPFTGNIIPASQISQQALNLLKYYPAPNIPTTGDQNYNYQTITTAGQNSTQVSLRYIRNFGEQPTFGGGRRQQNRKPTLSQNINFNGSYTGSASDNRNVFLPLGGATANTGYSAVAGYTIGYGRLRNNASLTWNRSHANTFNYFTNTASNPAQSPNAPIDIGNPAVYDNPFYFGVPSLSFTNFTGLSNASPSNTINQTISFSDFVGYSHKKHNMRFGFDVRRVHDDTIGGTDALGSFTFSGCATEAPYTNPTTGVLTSQCVPQTAAPTNPVSTATTGAGFADFLLGLPQESQVQANGNKLYLRENVFDWYAQDDFRVKPGVTLNYGLRYEYFGPFYEKENRLTNLDHNAAYTAVALVTPGEVGPISGIRYPRSLVNGDKALYSPRFGLAWRPGFVKDTVVRAGYGINFNTTQFSRVATNLSDQPPFAVTQTNTAYTTAGCGQLTLANAFNCSTAATQSNYGINPFYRLGHVQVWNVDIQHTLGQEIVLNLGYTGSKGGDLDTLTAPNRTLTGLLDPNAQTYTYENSLSFSRQNNLAVNARQRMHKGVSLQATYIYGHSIDDASSVNGTGNSIAQNPNNLLAEESNSSFDVRHQLSGNFVYELPFGPNRAFLASGGAWSKVLDGFNVSGTYAIRSGSYFTPQYSSSTCEVATGVDSSQRPDRVFTQPIRGPHTVADWFNKNAFAAPLTANGSSCGYGTASRYSILGPGSKSLNASLSRTFSFPGDRSMETRVTAANVFNMVEYSGINTTLNSATYGQITGANAMRSLTFLARYRF
jgi:hypothetical protein